MINTLDFIYFTQEDIEDLKEVIENYYEEGFLAEVCNTELLNLTEKQIKGLLRKSGIEVPESLRIEYWEDSVGFFGY